MKRAIVTGASTGIGNALARELARRGYALALLARRGDLLEALAARLREQGAIVATRACDVSEASSVQTAVAETAAELGGTFDLAIANAGVHILSHATSFEIGAAEQTIRVNVLGVMYLFDAVIPRMLERGRGRFVGVASVAGLRGLPTNAVYSASKAALQAFLEASRIELAPHGVAVTTVNPGFVATPMTEASRFRMPFLMQAADAAVVIADGIERGARVIEFPRPMSFLMRAVRLLPDALYDRVATAYARKKIGARRVK